jgi:hypothetical protein
LSGSLLNLGPTTITFVNESPAVRRVYWLNALGLREFRFELQPGDWRTEPSYTSHTWAVTNAGGSCLALYKPVSGDGIAHLD